MFFKELYAVAKHTPFTMIITPLGERLSVIIQPRPSGDAEDRKGLAAPIKAVGTPEELDTELPAKLAEYAGKVNDVRARIDLPLEAVDSEKATASKKAARAEKRAAKKKDAAAAAEAKKKARIEARDKRNADAAKKAKERADKRAEQRAAKKPKAPSLPGATRPASEPAAAHREGLPGKPECLEDYRTLKGVHGDKLTRRLFIKKAKTGRRYEKLWPNWEKFTKEAGAQGELPLDVLKITGSDAPESLKATKVSDLMRDERIVTAIAAELAIPAHADAQPVVAKPHKVYDIEGKLLHETKYPLVIGEKVKPAGSTYDWRVEYVDGNHYVARMTLPGKQLVIDEYAKEIAHVEGVYTPGEHITEIDNVGNFQLITVAVDCYVARHLGAPRWVVFDLEGKEFSCLAAEPSIGESVEIRTGADRREIATMRVVEIDGKDVTVAPIKPKQRAAEPAAATQE